MNLAICTISFRHHLISIEQVARWAQAHRFQGIELWGAHARNLAADQEYGAEWLRGYGLAVVMLSDYLPLEAPPDELWGKLEQLSNLARRWGTRKLRTFAGRLGSAETSAADRAGIVARLRGACQRLSDCGQLLLVETHPSTLADTAESTLRLLAEVDHAALRINFDVLHVWEGGDEPSRALSQLRPHVSHLHLKNVSHRERLEVFAPANVYSAAGSRAGMVPLFEGAFDYRAFLAELAGDARWDASLEWFGDDVKGTLSRDRRAIEQLASAPAARGQRLNARAARDI
ncbi:MAG: sugar phosphate isomerase/epimerase [Myxococcales bacterium]|nr:MAG: sugar phosphate isomerase/epimerase [Myxococcales bacterium]